MVQLSTPWRFLSNYFDLLFAFTNKQSHATTNKTSSAIAATKQADLQPTGDQSYVGKPSAVGQPTWPT